MMHHCQTVNIMEFIPSLRFAKQCHYWKSSTDIGCSFGDWHPLSAEKLVTMVLNTADDVTTYSKGYATVPGFSKITCPTSEL